MTTAAADTGQRSQDERVHAAALALRSARAARRLLTCWMAGRRDIGQELPAYAIQGVRLKDRRYGPNRNRIPTLS